MKNKKAQEVFLPEVVKIILAVIVIGILIFLAVGLYSIFTRSTKLEQAQSLLNEIQDKAEPLKEDYDHSDILVLSPRDEKEPWGIIGFEEKLCVCQNKWFSDKDDCMQNGVCKSIEISLPDPLILKTPLEISVYQKNNKAHLEYGTFFFTPISNEDNEYPLFVHKFLDPRLGEDILFIGESSREPFGLSSSVEAEKITMFYEDDRIFFIHPVEAFPFAFIQEDGSLWKTSPNAIKGQILAELLSEEEKSSSEVSESDLETQVLTVEKFSRGASDPLAKEYEVVFHKTEYKSDYSGLKNFMS